MAVTVVEVGLRDGLQSEKTDISVGQRYEIVKKLSAARLRRIELGSFVSPKAIPQMKEAPTLVKKVLRAQNKGILPKNIHYFAFVPNEFGFHKALECGLKGISFFISCTESFSQKNVNKSIKENLKVLHVICRQARPLKIKVRVYLSVAFGCPYEGKVRPSKVKELADQIMQEDVFEISISDTVGWAHYKSVLHLMDGLLTKVPTRRLALHFHDTRGMALLNILAGLEQGVGVFDSSVGGLGGCPYAPGASGNVATEDLAYMLEKMGVSTGLAIPEIIKTTHFVEKILKSSLPSKISVADLSSFS